MNDDELERALGAYRERHSPPTEARVEATRAAILDRIDCPRKRSKRGVWLWAAAVIFGAPLAWAHVIEPFISSSKSASKSASKPLSAPPTSTKPAEDADTLAFEKARAVHARANEAPAEALNAWDEYLSAHPDGKLVPEARWNRATCLLRLGRRADAMRALAPFARGEISGGFRQDEAQLLLEHSRASEESHERGEPSRRRGGTP